MPAEVCISAQKPALAREFLGGLELGRGVFPAPADLPLAEEVLSPKG